MRPAPPAMPATDLPPIPDHRRAAAVALALAADGDALSAAFIEAKVPALPRKIAINLSEDAEPAWALFNHEGGLLRTAPPGPRPRGTTELRFDKLVQLDGRFEAAAAVGQKRCEVLLRTFLDHAETLTRAEFRAVERLIPLLAGRVMELYDHTIEGASTFADEHRRIDARKRETPALLTHQWLRLQSIGHLALVLSDDLEALDAINDEYDGPQGAGDDGGEPVPAPRMVHRVNLDFGLIGPVVRGLRALGGLHPDQKAEALACAAPPPERFVEALTDLPLVAVAGLTDPGLREGVLKALTVARAMAELQVEIGAPDAELHLRLVQGLTAMLAGSRAVAKSRRAWLRAMLEAAPELARVLKPAPAEAPAAAEPSVEPAATASTEAAKAPAREAPAEEAPGDEAPGGEGDGEDAWEDLAMLALLQRPVDWRAQSELFIDLLTHLLPWALARRPRDLYPVEALATALTAPPPTYWLHEHTLMVQAHMRPAPIVREVPKLGRNEPCTCGSGKKFKKCCGG